MRAKQAENIYDHALLISLKYVSESFLQSFSCNPLNYLTILRHYFDTFD